MAIRMLKLGAAFALGAVASDDFAVALEADDVCHTGGCALELAQLRAVVRPGLPNKVQPTVEFIESKEEFDESAAARLCHGLDFSTATVAHSNLGGQGPDDGAETLQYENVIFQDGVPVDMIITAASPYFPNTALKNGIHGGLFGLVNVAVNSAVDLTFRFVDRHGSPVTVNPFFFTLYDIDQGMDHASRESITARGFSEYRVAEETELRIEVLGDDSATFTSSLRGGKVDNPTHPMALTNAEKERTVVLKFPATSEFSLSFSESAYADEDQGRNLLFSGPSSMVCGREHMCTDYICPDGYHIRTMAEFLVCSGRTCTESDRDTCCYEMPEEDEDA